MSYFYAKYPLTLAAGESRDLSLTGERLEIEAANREFDIQFDQKGFIRVDQGFHFSGFEFRTLSIKNPDPATALTVTLITASITVENRALTLNSASELDVDVQKIAGTQITGANLPIDIVAQSLAEIVNKPTRPDALKSGAAQISTVATQTQIVAANANRHRIHLQYDNPTLADYIRITDGVSANAIELRNRRDNTAKAMQHVTLETTAAIYGYASTLTTAGFVHYLEEEYS